MNDTRAMFANARTALGVSYGAPARAAHVPCSLRHALVALMQGARLTNARQRDWYARLLGSASVSVDLSGLTPFERHAQCSMIRRTVDALPTSQACAIMCAFSLSPEERERGFTGLTTDLSARRASRNPAVIRELIERRYTPSRMLDGLSLRDIGSRVSLSKSQLFRLAQDVDRECSALEAEAMGELERRFSLSGMCPNPVITLSDDAE